MASSGSVYSRLGIGYPIDIANTAARGMGLEGISYNDTFVGSLANPAHWGSTVYGLGMGGVELQSYDATSGNSSATNSNFSLAQFQLQLPIVRGKVGLSGSFSPVTQSSFKTSSESTRILGGGSLQDTVNVGLENRGSGGLNRAELGVGWQISSRFSVGYAASVMFLSMNNKYFATFPQSSYRPANFAVETSGAGFGNRFGAYARFPNVWRSKDLLGAGLTVEFPVTIDAEQKNTGTINGGGTTIVDESATTDGNIRMPMKISGGISYHPSNALMVATEGFYQSWSNYENELDPSEESYFVDRYKWGVGMQYFPYVTEANTFLSNFKYRVGASYDSGHLKLEGERINTLMFSLGLGLRSPRSNSSVDLSLEYGIRGTNSMDLAKEQIWGVRLTLNLAEIMFFRPKLQ